MTTTSSARLAFLKAQDAAASTFLTSSQDQAPQVRGLFLGIGESGKSTVFKQMRLNYGREFDAAERAQYKKVIWAEILRGMRRVVDQMLECEGLYCDFDHGPLQHQMRLLQSLDLTDGVVIGGDIGLQRYFGASQVAEPGPNPKPYKLRQEVEAAQAEMVDQKAPDNMISLYSGTTPTREQAGAAVHMLWTQSRSIKEFVGMGRAEIDHNMPYFFDKVVEFSDPTHEPTEQDILMARIKTTGLISDTFNIKGNPLVIVDVGGQRTERKKWIHCFDNATCVLYVVNASDYHTAGLAESLKVFEEVMTNKGLSDKPVALFLNKMDILVKNLRLFPFEQFYPTFEGNPRSVDEVTDFIERQFRTAINVPASSIYTYRTCATDRYAMQFVVEAVTNMIFIENLKWAGMM